MALLTGRFQRGRLAGLKLQPDENESWDSVQNGLDVYGAILLTGEYSGIRYPAEPLVVKDLQGIFGNSLRYAPNVQSWITKWKKGAESSACMQSVTDVDVLPWQRFRQVSPRVWNKGLRPYQRVGASWLSGTGSFHAWR